MSRKEKIVNKCCGVTFVGNNEQAELFRLINDPLTSIVLCEGSAGTGKNFISIASAMQLHFDKKYENLYYTRSPIQVGPQTETSEQFIDEKINPFMCPLLDTIESIVKHSTKKYNVKQLMSMWKLIPMSYVRGRNLDGILIVDEAQNLSLTEIQTLCTRINEYSKIIFIGSFKQIDNKEQKKKDKCDYETTMEALKQLPYVKSVQLKKSMRSHWCSDIDNVFEELKSTNK